MSIHICMCTVHIFNCAALVYCETFFYGSPFKCTYCDCIIEGGLLTHAMEAHYCDSPLSHIQSEYYQSPLELVRVVQECLLKEQELVDKQDHLNVSLFIF